jgi:HSP20 family protein
MRKAYLTRRPSPFLPDPLFRRFDQFFGQEPLNPTTLLARWNESLDQDSWIPAVDVRETDEEFVFTADLPGLAKDDVQITLEDKVLTISGERKFEGKEENQNYHRIERSYGTFSRSFTLPHEVNQDKVKANFDNGLLTVSVAKAEEIKPRKIEIS